MLIRSAAKRAATEGQVAREVSLLLERRAAMTAPPVTAAVSDAVALGIAALFRGPTTTGQVLDGFLRTGSADSDELIEAARFEQGYASPEGHAALYCLIGWVRSRCSRAAGRTGAR